MSHTETIEEFYQRNKLPQTGTFIKDHGHFNVYSQEHCKGTTPYKRRDFYKISFVLGKGFLHYADKSIEIDSPALVFSNPLIPSAWEPISTYQGGYFCLFTMDFIQSYGQNDVLHGSSLYKAGENPVFFVKKEQEMYIKDVFTKMQEEMQSAYALKYDLLYNYVQILIHEAHKMQSATTYFKQKNASSRIVSLFSELLERQFPINSPAEPLQLKTAADYANQLSVHVNHLNHAMKEITGKTTSAHITERIVREAKTLLLHTDMNITEVAYSLGFEYPSYFNSFFRKRTNLTPRALRNEVAKMDR